MHSGAASSKPAARCSRLGFDNTTPVSDAIDQAEQEVFKIGQESRGSEMRNIAPVVREWWDVLEKRIEHKQLVTGVPDQLLEARHAHPGAAAR